MSVVTAPSVRRSPMRAKGRGPFEAAATGECAKVSFGTVVILTGVAVLALWWPLRQWPGLGTVANTLVIGVATDATLAVLTTPGGAGWRWVLLLGGIVLNGLAGALYIGSQYGPGPRDGLMTGLVARTGGSVRVVRTSMEVLVVLVGFLLGGTLGIGTVLYAVGVGPLIQLFARTGLGGPALARGDAHGADRDDAHGDAATGADAHAVDKVGECGSSSPEPAPVSAKAWLGRMRSAART